jgi:ABC-2 type transport system permease protein
LTVPVHRTRLLAVKYVAIVIFAFGATGIVAGTGIVMGLVLFGGGDMTLLSGSQVGFSTGLVRVLAVTVYLAVGFAALGAVGIFVSTLTEQPIGATITVVLFCVTSFILDTINQLGWLHPYLITHYWTSFGDFLRTPVAWDGVQHGLFLAAAYAVVFWLAAWARFASRDITT